MAGSSRRSSFLVIFIILVCGFFGVLLGQRSNSATVNSDAEVRDSLHTFSQVYSAVESNYAEPVSADKAIYNGAIPGMLRVLDPHSWSAKNRAASTTA